ncbi:hypothetical protein S245_065590, partial [Arachis hypogaea]
GLNVEFESKNKKLSEDLAAAKAKMVVAVGTSGKVKFAIQYMGRAIQKLLGCTEENPEEGKG